MSLARWPAVSELFSVLSTGADAAIIAIGLMLMRMERRLTRLELKVFGFGMGKNNEG